MAKPFLTQHLSLAVKNALIYLILILFSSFLIGYSVYRLSAALILASSKDKIKNDVQNVALKMSTYFDHIGRDIRFMANNPLVKDYIKGGKLSESLQSILTEEFKVLMESRASYFQIRLIGVENNGKELVRVDRQGNTGIVISPENLQQKGDRNYFVETIKLKEGSVYFSEIDLNQEFGRFDVPYKPTLRAASPLYFNDKIAGIVIINTDLGQLFAELEQTKTPNEDLFIFNSDAYFIIHPEQDERFGFEFGRPPNAYNRFPEIKNLDPRFQQGPPSMPSQSEKKNVTEFYILRHPNTDYTLFIALSTMESNILYPFISWRKNAFLLTLGITFVFLGIAFLWMRRQSKELRSITQSMVRFSKDYSGDKLLINNTDEIGELANAFSTMASVIRSNVSELERSRETAVKANQSKEEFLENMSHEIRNPLQSILGMTNILEQNNPRADQKAVIKTIQFSSNQLLSLVNDILDYSKIRIGEIQLQTAESNLADLLTDIVRSHQFLAQSKNIVLESMIPRELTDYTFRVDELRLSQVLNNLIVNAIKFTPSGGRVIVAVNAKIQLPQATLDFTVTDDGIGIGPGEVQKIINRYYSGPTEMNSNLSGAGLGLPIVTQLLKLFHSELKVNSELNKGSSFSFTLSLPCTIKQAASINHPEAKRQIPSSIQTVLCLDDDPQILYFFKQAFTHLGPGLTCIADEAELNDLPPQVTFDLILADFLVKNSTTAQLLNRLANHKKREGLLLIFSGIDPLLKFSESDRILIDGFLQKPMSAALLFNQIQKLWYVKHCPQPQMHDFYSDYDFDQTLVGHALRILIDEWKIMKTVLLQSSREMDKERFNQVFHKIITTIRRFQLAYLLESLERIQQNLDQDIAVSMEDDTTLELMLDRIQHYFEKQLTTLPAEITKY
ncbi:MAG: ATP-binding protein [Saprospiraceae bacterium]|nr:ATP-binding protein [Saprospiraceae bacterium]